MPTAIIKHTHIAVIKLAVIDFRPFDMPKLHAHIMQVIYLPRLIREIIQYHINNAPKRRYKLITFHSSSYLHGRLDWRASADYLYAPHGHIPRQNTSHAIQCQPRCGKGTSCRVSGIRLAVSSPRPLSC